MGGGVRPKMTPMTLMISNHVKKKAISFIGPKIRLMV
jgi:hypothetical protein